MDHRKRGLLSRLQRSHAGFSLVELLVVMGILEKDPWFARY